MVIKSTNEASYLPSTSYDDIEICSSQNLMIKTCQNQHDSWLNHMKTSIFWAGWSLDVDRYIAIHGLIYIYFLMVIYTFTLIIINIYIPHVYIYIYMIPIFWRWSPPVSSSKKTAPGELWPAPWHVAACGKKPCSSSTSERRWWLGWCQGLWHIGWNLRTCWENHVFFYGHHLRESTLW